MRMLVVAEPEEKFNTWLAAQRQPVGEPVYAEQQRGRTRGSSEFWEEDLFQ